MLVFSLRIRTANRENRHRYGAMSRRKQQPEQHPLTDGDRIVIRDIPLEKYTAILGLWLHDRQDVGTTRAKRPNTMARKGQHKIE